MPEIDTLETADTVYQGGMIWQGSGFNQADLAVKQGLIIEPYSIAPTTKVIDASDTYITPALANGHQHITSPTLENTWLFFETGVYYVWNPNLYSSGLSEETQRFFARADTIDVKTSLGGITEPESHPEPLYVYSLGPYVYNGATYEDLYQRAFHYGRTKEEILEALDRLSGQGADFVKIYLLDSQNYVAPDADGTPNSLTGLNPENVTFLVRQAHARNLPVVAHIESRVDFRVALAAGVDYLGHLPGYNGVREARADVVTLTREDARLAAKTDIHVIPTYALAPASYVQKRNRETPLTQKEEAQLAVEEALTRDIQSQNLNRLISAGVPVLVGTDMFPGQVLEEPLRWQELGAMSPEQTLKAMFATGPALFPDRSIGCLEAGCEADFLLLKTNPLDDLYAFSSIKLRVKSGRPLEKPENISATQPG